MLENNSSEWPSAWKMLCFLFKDWTIRILVILDIFAIGVGLFMIVNYWEHFETYFMIVQIIPCALIIKFVLNCINAIRLISEGKISF